MVIDYRPIEEFLVGRCGMTQEQAGWTSFREYEIRRKAAEEKDREDWEKRRWELFIMMQMHPHMKPHQKPKSPDKWIRFPWEKTSVDDAITEVTDNEVDKLTEIFKRWAK